MHVRASDRELMGFARRAPSRSFMRWCWCDFREGAQIETITCKRRLLAPRDEWMSPGEGTADAVGGWGGGRRGGVRKKREGDSDLSGREEKKNNSAEWETGLPGSWQKDISPWWQGQKPLSMSCTLQGQQRQEGRGGLQELQRVCFLQKKSR